MASWWTITVPTGFEDVTAEAMKNPAFKAGLDKVTAQGGSTTAHFWTNDDTVVLALDATFSGMPDSMAVLEGFENGARKTSYGTGKEISYTSTKDAHFVISQQHATNSAGEIMWTHRWTGRNTQGSLQSLGVVCTGNEATCKSVLATVKADGKDFVNLSSLPAEGKSSAYAIGYAVGAGLVGVFVLYALVKARQRSRAA